MKIDLQQIIDSNTRSVIRQIVDILNRLDRTLRRKNQIHQAFVHTERTIEQPDIDRGYIILKYTAIDGSTLLWINGNLLGINDYNVDGKRLYLASPPALGHSLRIQYSYLAGEK